MQIYVVNGSGGVGKDTFVDACLKLLGEDGAKYSTVDYVKKIASICGWTGRKEERDRKFLSDLKNLLSEWNDVPWRDVVLKIAEFRLSKEAVFIFSREPKEIERFVSEYDAKTILVKNNKVKKINSNNSDRDVENYDYDFYIDNNGAIFELKNMAYDFLKGEELI